MALLTPSSAARLAAAFAIAVSCAASAAEGATREYQVKAAFLLNFAQYVEWPESAFASPDQPIRVGVLGDDPFGRTLDDTLAGEKVHDRPLQVVRSRDAEQLAGCHIVFVAASGHEPTEKVLKALQGPVLTVGDDESFARRGGDIGFLIEKGRVRFAINAGAAKAAGLKLAAALLNLGRGVDDARGRDR